MIKGEVFAQQQKFRLQVLEAMVGETVSQKKDLDRTYFSPRRVSEDLRVSAEDVSLAMEYLEDRQLIRSITDKADYETLYKVTHRGVEEIEKVYSAPERGTDHFSPQVINLTFQAPVGTIQTGPNATAHVTQNIGADLSSIFALIEQLKRQANELPDDKQEEAQVHLDMLEAELKNGKEPKRIKVFVKRLSALGQGTAAAVGFGANATTLVTQAQALGLF